MFPFALAHMVDFIQQNHIGFVLVLLRVMLHRCPRLSRSQCLWLHSVWLVPFLWTFYVVSWQNDWHIVGVFQELPVLNLSDRWFKTCLKHGLNILVLPAGFLHTTQTW